MPDIVQNRKATHEYTILETYEAGIELFGHEVKSVRAGRMTITGSFVIIRNNEAWLIGATIPPYQAKNTPTNYEPERTRRLLLKHAEIKELVGKTSRQGLTVVPLKLYNKNNRIKLLIGLGRHKKAADKRETIKKRDTEREVRRTLKRG